MANLSTTTDLVINKLSQAKYNQLCAAGQLDPYQLYLTDGIALDAGNSQIVNVANPVLSTDAANKAYVDSSLSNIDLNDYYKKTETSSAAQISNELKKYQLSGNYLSSNALDNYKTYAATVSSLSNDGYATSSQIPLSTSQLVNDTGFLSSVKLLPKINVSGLGDPFVLSANCTNVLQQNIIPGNIIVLDNYDYDNVYAVELTADNSSSAIYFEILASMTVNGVEGLYDIGLGSQLSTLSPNQKYKFSISHEKIHIENDNALRSLSSSAKTIPYFGDYVDFYPVVDSFNSIDALDFTIEKAFIVMPQLAKSDDFTKSRSFSLQVLHHSSDFGMFPIELSAVDAVGNPVNFCTVEGDAISSIVDQDLSSYQIVFEETTAGNFLVSRKGYGGSGGGGNQRYQLVTLAGTLSSGTKVYEVEDQTIATIQLSSSSIPVLVKLPAKPDDGGARDFILRVEITSNEAPTVTFQGVDESIDFDSEDDEWYVLEPGLNIISFTETK